MGLKDLYAEIDRQASTPDPIPVTPVQPEQSGLLRRTVGDMGIKAVQGAIAVPQSIVGLADIPTGGRVGKFLEENVGFKPQEAQQVLGEYLSPEYKANEAAFREAEGVGGKLKAAITNPSLIAGTVVESAPSMLGGAGLARGAVKAIPKLATVGAGLGIGRGVVATGLGEGAISAGATEEQIRAESEDGTTTAGQGALALGSGLAVGALAVLGGKLAGKLGVDDPDALIAGFRQAGTGETSRLGRMAGGALTEGIFEELPQSVVEQVAANAASDKPLGEGVLDSAILGALAGGVMGGGTNIGGGVSTPVHKDTQDVLDLANSIIEGGGEIPAPAPVATPFAETTPAPVAAPPAEPIADPEAAYSFEEMQARRQAQAENDARLNAASGLGEVVEYTPRTAAEAPTEMLTEALFAPQSEQGKRVVQNELAKRNVEMAQPAAPQEPTREYTPEAAAIETTEALASALLSPASEESRLVVQNELRERQISERGDQILAARQQTKEEPTAPQEPVVEYTPEAAAAETTERLVKAVTAPQSEQGLRAVQTELAKRRQQEVNVVEEAVEPAPVREISEYQEVSATPEERGAYAAQAEAKRQSEIAGLRASLGKATTKEAITKALGGGKKAKAALERLGVTIDDIKAGVVKVDREGRGYAPFDYSQFSDIPLPAELQKAVVDEAMNVAAGSVAGANFGRGKTWISQELANTAKKAQAGEPLSVTQSEFLRGYIAKALPDVVNAATQNYESLTPAKQFQMRFPQQDNETPQAYTARLAGLWQQEQTQTQTPVAQEQAPVAQEQAPKLSKSGAPAPPPVDIPVDIPVDNTTPVPGKLSLFASKFGKRVEFVRAGKAFKGRMVPGTNTVQINLDAVGTNAYFQVAMHELIHHLQTDLPSAYNMLRTLAQNDATFQEFVRSYGATNYAELDNMGRVDEALAEWVANRAQSKEFWVGVTEQQPSLWSQLRSAFARLLKRGGKQLDKGTKDTLALIDKAALDALKDYAKAQGMPVEKARTAMGQGTPKYSKAWDIPQQTVGSAATSISYPDVESKSPIIFRAFREGRIQLGPVNADIGGGRFNQITDWLAGKGVTNLVWDKFNRDAAHNDAVQSQLEGGQANTATISNVLNVIDTPAARAGVIATAFDAVKPGGTVFISTYTAPKAGAVKGRDSFQTGMKTKEYVPEVERVFGEGNVEVKRDLIIATKPRDVAITEKFSKIAENLDLPPQAGEWIDKMAEKAKGLARRGVDALMPFNRRVDLLRNNPYYAAIRAPLDVLLDQTQRENSVQDGELTTAYTVTKGWEDVAAKSANKNELTDSYEVANKASLFQLDPSKPLEDQDIVVKFKGDMTQAGAAWKRAVGVSAEDITLAGAYSLLKQKYNKLAPATQKAYLDNVRYISDLHERTLKEWTRVVESLDIAPEAKAKQLALLQKRSNRLMGNYVPLSRFGDIEFRVDQLTEDDEGNQVWTRLPYAERVRGNHAATLKLAELKEKYPGAGYRVSMMDVRAAAFGQPNRISPAMLEKLQGLLGKAQSAAKLASAKRMAREWLDTLGEGVFTDRQTEILQNIAKARTPRALDTALTDLKTDIDSRADAAALQEYMKNAMEEAGLSTPYVASAIQDMERMFLESLPESSIFKNSMRRKGLAGFDEDTVRSVRAYAQRHARALAYLKHGRNADRALTDAAKAAKAIPDPQQSLAAQQRVTDLKQDRDTLVSVKTAEWIKVVNSVATYGYLSSPSLTIVQNSQPWLITLPQLMARHGVGRAIQTLWRNHFDVMASKKFDNDTVEAFNADPKYKPAEWGPNRRYTLSDHYNSLDAAGRTRLLSRINSDGKLGLFALQMGIERGAINISNTHELTRDILYGDSARPASHPIERTKEFLIYAQKMSELHSRKAAFMAAFELNNTGIGNFDAAVESALKTVHDTLYDINSRNSAVFLTTSLGQLTGKFRIFQLQTLGKIATLWMQSTKSLDPGEKALARKELAYMMASNFALAGVSGLPMAGSVLSFLGALSWLFGADDDPWDLERDLREELMSMGKPGQVVMSGVPMLFGMDLARRIGLGSVFEVVTGEPPTRATAADRVAWLTSRLAGPAANAIFSTAASTQVAMETGDWSKAAKGMVPRGIADAAKAIELYNKGVVDGGGRVIIPRDEISMYDVALMVSGVNPAEVSVAREKLRNVREVTAENQIRKQRLVKELHTAVSEGDADAIQSVSSKMRDFNLKHPTMGFTSSGLASSLRTATRKQFGFSTKTELAAEQELGREL